MRTEKKAERLNGMEAVFAAGGDAGRLMLELDWSQTQLGPVSGWPQSLRSAVSICLLSRFPMVVWWGPELVFIFNDAYRPVLGVKDPLEIMGRVGREVWPEIWPIIGPMLHGVMTRREATWSDDGLLFLERNGYLEECYFTFSYSPIQDESGGVGGVFTAVTETTQRVIGERRLRTLSELAESSVEAKTAEDACVRAVEALARNPADIPFAELYLLDQSRTPVLIAATATIDGLAPRRWPLADVAASGVMRRVELPVDDAREDAPRSAVVLPMGQTAQAAPIGMLVAGVSPRRALDTDYQRFFELVARQVGSAVADALAYEAERKRAEALAELDRAKTAFFSNVSHEFRTPLTLLLGPLEQALSRLPAGQRDEIEVAHRNALRLLRLVNTLLDFSRIEAGRIEASYEPVDLSQLTSDLASAFRSAVESAGLQLLVECSTLEEPAYLDVEMWEKIVLNLISNAFKYTFDGSITVRTRMTENNFELIVSDTGAGIADEELPHLFERFYRVRGARSRTHEGTGIGLSLVHELVALHKGQIRVESKLGAGTKFTVSIPRGSDHLPADRIRAPRALVSTAVGAAPFVEEALRWLPNASGEPESPTWSTTVDSPRTLAASINSARVLVVDDNADMRDYLIALLSPHWRVEAVGDGAAALRIAQAATPDLVLTDAMMPGMDGFELLRALRSGTSTKHVPVVMLSGRAGDEATVEGLQAGADDYLVKPFVARELIARVRANLELSSMRLLTEATIERYGEAERALQRALASLAAIAQHIRAGVELPALLGRLSETVAQLVSSRRAVFWRVDGDELFGEAEAYGFDAALLAQMRVPINPEGNNIVDRIVFHGELFNARFDRSEQFAPYRRAIDALEATDAIGVPWRAGDRPLGLLAAYDSLKPGGFSDDDVWVLRIAALAAALVLEHKRAEDKLAEVSAREAVRLKEELDRSEQLEKTKSEFLRLASHELRGPITVIAGYMALIRNGLLGDVPGDMKSVLPILDSKLRDMRLLVDQMLETARLEDHKLALNLMRLDLRDVLAAAEKTIAPLVPTSHELTVVLPEHPVSVEGDLFKLETVVTNLIDNAVRYSPDGGPVEVVCRTEDGNAIVSVADRGIGIATGDLPRLFKRFGRIVTPENSHIPGTGLGLYLAGELARLHGGAVTVTSELHAGSTFSLTLPLAGDLNGARL